MATLLNFLREDSPGSGTFPEARKYVNIAKYYGFDGYFINQETTGSGIHGKGAVMRDLMVYAKKYANSIDYPIRFSWYDAMTNEGPRTHYNAVNRNNDYFVTPRDGVIPGDEFFINFNWSKSGNISTANHMKSIGRTPFDAYAGFELQQNSINTGIRWDSLIGEDKKAIVSIGLFTPDSILGFSKDGEDYHVQERNFWTGYEGDPSISGDRSGWRGMSRFVSDSSPVTSIPFKTFFNTGHGRNWFENGELSVYDSSEKIASPANPKVKDHLLFDAKNSEALIEFDAVEGADYYVVYADNGDDFEFVQASSSSLMYLPNIVRKETSEGTVQKLRIVAVGLNGTISEPAELDLDWKMVVEDTGNGIVIDSPNVVLGAKVLGKSGEESGERAENALNGTITGNSDKWTVAGAYSGWMEIRLTEERTIRRWRIEHAGHGGESVNDGLMNTKDFELQYRVDENSPWITAKHITNNRAHVTDVNLDEPITAQDFRLKINVAHNGSPWGAIRIYNWMMFEQALDLEATQVVPISQVTADYVGNGNYKIVLRNVEEKTKVELFSDREAKNSIAEQTTTEKGHVIFDNQKLEGESGLVYYRTTAEGKNPSDILAVYYEKGEEPEQPQVNKDNLQAAIKQATM